MSAFSGAPPFSTGNVDTTSMVNSLQAIVRILSDGGQSFSQSIISSGGTIVTTLPTIAALRALK